MKAMTASQSRSNYADTLDTVVNDREEIVITRPGKESVVMVALDDYEAMKETAYLLSSPENARRLFQSIAEMERGQVEAHDLAE